MVKSPMFNSKADKLICCFYVIVALCFFSVNAHAACYSMTHVGDEYKVYYDDFHFITFIYDGNTIVIRPHPGKDVNGWGTSVYWSPHSSTGVIKFTNTPVITVDCSGVSMSVSGSVTRGTFSTYGTWSMSGVFTYNPSTKKISGSGDYSITLSGSLSVMTGGLNLMKIASNYLDDVPLLSGGNGDTGDMSKVVVAGISSYSDSSPYIPPDVTTQTGNVCAFPWEFTDYLSMNVVGQYNEVDVAELGGCPISPAYKPSVKIQLTSSHPDEEMVFGVCYNADESKDFYADNLGVTPLIADSSSYTQHDFTFVFESEAIAGDGPNEPDIQTNHTCPNTGTASGGYPADPITLTLSNTGLANLSIGQIIITGTDATDFKINNDYCSNQVITPTNDCTFQVQLWPETTGSKNAEVEIPSNDSDENPLIIQLSGSASNPVVEADIQVDNGNSYDFGWVGTGMGSSHPATFTISNSGIVNLDIGTIEITGTNYTQFQIKNDFCSGATLAAGITCTLDVLLWTNSDGYKEANLEIPSNDPDENPVIVQLSGTAEGPTLVDLLFFRAKNKKEKIILRWKTDSETNTAGFNILRKKGKGKYERINESIIYSKGNDAVSGGKYKFIDNDVNPNVKYRYKLYEVEINGTEKMLEKSKKVKLKK